MPDPPSSLDEFIDSAGWTFAKTMPTIPHFYTVRGLEIEGVPAPPVEWHDWFAEQIREQGYESKFYGRSYTYLEHRGWKYWVIDAVINRERLPDQPDYEPDVPDAVDVEPGDCAPD